MTNTSTDVNPQISPDTSPADLDQLVAAALAGRDVDGLFILASDNGRTIELPGGLDYTRPFLIDGSIALLQPNGDAYVLLDAAEEDFILRVEDTGIAAPASRLAAIAMEQDSWDRLGDIDIVEIPDSITRPYAPNADSSATRVLVNDPLVGLPIHPLLPPTEYLFERRDDWEIRGNGTSPADVIIDPTVEGGIVLAETDGMVSFLMSDWYTVSSEVDGVLLEFVTIGVTLPGLPVGTTANGGSFTATADGTLTFTFSGSVDAFESIRLTLPTDFSTESRIDALPGILEGVITATSDLGDDTSAPLTLEVRQEADIALDGPGVLTLAETDAPVDFRPVNALLPTATDIDGSEHVDGVTLAMPGLPAGTLVSFDGGVSFTAAGSTLNFSGSLAEYSEIVIRLPTDFSTQNPASMLSGSVTATTDEGGRVVDTFDVSLSYELDVDLAAPPLIESSEDSRGGDGSGVEMFLGIRVAATDQDGSEDSTYVEITYQDAPPGITFNGGIYDPATATWTGTLTQATALVMTLPADHSGTITSAIRAISPEGTRQTTQVIEIAPAGDIDFDITDVALTETDAPIVVIPSDVWAVSISDFDPGRPFETLQTVTMTLDGVPPAVGGSPGISWRGVPDSTISYDAAGGTLTFSGTGAQYAALRLVFPRDFSTESRSDGFADGPITGTLSATSSEDASGGQDVPLSLTIDPEGDAAIDATMPYDDLIEDQPDPGTPGAPYPILPSDLLAPQATDIDGSEPLSQLVLVVEGLPATGTDGAPLTDPIDGSYLGLQVDAAADVVFARATDGSVTMTITLDADTVGDVIAAYEAIGFSVPPDFSTANRSDLTAGATELPLRFTLTARGAEEPDGTTDPFASATDGLVQATRTLEIAYEEDIDLAAPPDIEVLEDGGPISQTGTTIRLGVNAVTQDDIDAGNTGIDIAIGDIDGSETEAPGNDPFTAVVTIEFSRPLPQGTTFWNGGLEIGGYDAATLTWTGTVAQANALVMEFAPDVNGTVETVITVTTPEGQETTPQTLRIAPTPDAQVVGDVETTETDAPLEILLADYLQFVDPDSGETVVEATITIPGLPAGTFANAGSFSAPDANGLVTFTYAYPADATPPAQVLMTFPADFSTDSTINPPPGPFVADVNLVINPNTGEPNVSADSGFTITIHDEGDPRVDDRAMTITETDAALIFRPGDTAAGGIMPEATDLDGSESITAITVEFTGLPAGARYALVATPVDGDFQPIPAGGLTGLTLVQYGNLSIELPQDFSTENPAAGSLQLTVTATTNEGDATTNTDSGTLTVTVQAEGDLPEVADFTRVLAENDPATITDGDTTSSAPVQFKLAESLAAPVPSDIDGSESIAYVRVTVFGLPATGAEISLDNAATFTPITDETRDFTLAEYNQLVFRLPDDFSTRGTDITGSVTFVTDEDRDPTTDTPEDGQTTSNYTITVTPEADIRLTTADITQVEDYVAAPPDGAGQVIPLNLDVAVVDIDGSETLETVTLTFDGLPANGNTVLSDGTNTFMLNPGSNSISYTGSAADIALLQSLAIDTLPTHFSGRIDVTLSATSDEGGPISESFTVDITPDAEPAIALSVTENAPVVTEIADGNYIVKEDQSFVLNIEASTADTDGSEVLTQIVIDNVPAGWAGPDGALDPGLLSGDTAAIASATVSGTTITLTLVAGVTQINAGIQLAPLADDDRDVATILGDEITATVTSVDTAGSIPATDTDTASDSIDMDVDAVVDAASGAPDPVSADENTTGRRIVRLNANDIALSDNDGSETITGLQLTIGVDTASDTFDPATEMQLVVSAQFQDDISITPTVNGDGTITYDIVAPVGTSQADFTAALEDLQLSFPQHFSGVADLSGTMEWTETQTPATEPGDVEVDPADNPASGSFATTVTVAAVAEAILDASVFTLNADEVADGSPQRVEASIKDGSITADQILTLLESTADGTNQPDGVNADTGRQIHVFVSLSASTPDTDGSEELSTIVIRNIPTAWIATGDLPKSAFYSADGTAAIEDAQWAKIQSANYDPATGVLTITFNGDQTEFVGSLRLSPSTYEDYDVNRGDDYPENAGFTSAGDFFDGDLTVEATTRDQTTLTPATEQPDDATAAAEFDVDVDPVNNLATISAVPIGNEQVIDDAGGVWSLALDPVPNDMDGSETVISIVLQNVPQILTIYVPDLDNPGGPRIPALITALNQPPGYNVWSLEAGQWDDIEIRGIPTHYAGEVVGDVQVVTQETDGGGLHVTPLDVPLSIAPVVDGGNPSETAQTDEDTAVQVVIDGNIIDNSTNSPGSPEAIGDTVELTNIVADSFGRMPIFYDGDPAAGGNPIAYDEVGGTLTITRAQAQDLWVQAGQDSNETITFDVTVTYYETTDPSENTQVTGTVTVNVRGIADPADIDAQDPDPAANSNIADADVNAVYKQGNYDYGQLYGYAGYGDTIFGLDQKLGDDAIRNGFTSPDDSIFTAADPLSGTMTEIQNAGSFDGSETVYYIIDGVPTGGRIVGGQPISSDGSTYLLSESQLANLQFIAPDVAEVTFYELQLYAVVFENDQPQIELTGDDLAANLQAIDDLPGGSVAAQDFSIVALPYPDGDGVPCEDVPLPTLTFTPDQTQTDEDAPITIRPTLTPDGTYDSLDDLFDLPGDATGTVTVSIDLPPGAEIASDPPGAIYLDPTSGDWVIDIAKLGVSADGLTTDGSIIITPPPHQSSPDNPFDPSETLGPNDTYDSLDQIEFSLTLNNAGCGTTTPSGPLSFPIDIVPVADGPVIAFTGADSFDEDTEYALGIELDSTVIDQLPGMDGGERLTGLVEITITGGGTEGVKLFSADGTEIAPDSAGGGSQTFLVAPGDVAGLYLLPTQHFGGGTIDIKVTATTEDINGDVASNSSTKQVYVDAVADTPVIGFDLSQTDPDTGLPYVDISGATPILTIIEDIPFFTSPTIQADSPDQDGSEAVSVVVDLSQAPELMISGPSDGGFINNGDGTYTISESAFADVTLSLPPPHARTPDTIYGIPSEFQIGLSVQTLELSNSDEASFAQDLIVRVRPDADQPTLVVNAHTSTGTEDDPTPIALTLSATNQDPHEDIRFDITLPTDAGGNPLGQILLDGNPVAPVDGVVSIPGAGRGGPALVIPPAGAVTYLPPEDFGGDISLSVVAVSLDSTDSDAIFLDEQASVPRTINLTIDPTPDLNFNIDNPAVALTETDAALIYTPSDDITVEVTDSDGSEVATVTYTLDGTPDGTTWSSTAGSGAASGGTLTYSGTEDDFATLEITFPADFATNGVPLIGNIDVTTNEGGSGNGSFTIDIAGELDAQVTLAEDPIVVANAPGPEVVAFGIDAAIIPVDNEWETLEQVIIDFDQALPPGTRAPDGGTLNPPRTQLSFARNGADPATFAAAIAALSISIPLDLAEDFTGSVTVITSHGTADPVGFEVQFTDPAPAAPALAFLEPAGQDGLSSAPVSDGGNQADIQFTRQAEHVSPSAAQLMTPQPISEEPEAPEPQVPPEVAGVQVPVSTARGTDGADTVIVDDTTQLAGVEGFALLGGDDLIDLSGAARDFAVDGGAGDDTIIGSPHSDILTGGAGADRFVISGLTLEDVITDYEGPSSEGGGDTIDLSALVQLSEGEDLSEHVSYDSSIGRLSVDETGIAEVTAMGGGFAEEVAVIFEDASGQQASAVI